MVARIKEQVRLVNEVSLVKFTETNRTMNIEELRKLALSLPAVTEDVKWGNDLCFLIGGKMFCVAALSGAFTVSFKVTDEQFIQLTDLDGIIPAPYMARNKWVQVQDVSQLKTKDWLLYIEQSYNLVKSKLTKKVRQELNI